MEGQAGPAKPQRRPGACGQPATFPAAPLPSPSPEALAKDELTADPTKAPTDHSSGQLGPGTQIDHTRDSPVIVWPQPEEVLFTV